MTEISGSCHCGNIQVRLTLSQPPLSYNPRACDCSFCQKHGAAYISDAKGELEIQVRDPKLLSHYQQGSETADFWVCRTCGNLVAVLFANQGETYAAVNTRILDSKTLLGEPVTVSPQKLSKEEKTKRWQQVWFSKVIQK